MHVLLYQEEDKEAEEKEEKYVRNPFLFVCAGCQNLISSSHVCEANILYQARGFRVFSYCDIYFVVFVLFFRHEMSFLSTAISARGFIASTVLPEMRLFLVCRSALETIFQTSCKRGCSLFNKL